MDAKRLSATNPTDTHADNDKYATTHQLVSGAAPLWIQLKLGANLPLSFGRYEIQRVLGEGAMAAVYLAQDKQLGRLVAIKIPKFEPNDQAGMKRFFRESRTMATLRHPHLCPVYDVGEIEGVHYFTMAYIEGGTLADHIASDAPMSSRRVAVLVAKIASALHAAHQTGTVHRDLKPANIMIDQNNEPVLMDFGLAGLAEAESSLTRSGEMIGTPAYMAPEQITGNLPAIGPPSDVYGLGAIMYEMLTGQLPFGGSVASVVQQALQAAPVAPTAIRPTIDAALSAICLKAMARASEDRFASADELAISLRDYLRGVSSPPVSAPAEGANSGTRQWEADAVRVREFWRAEQFDAALAILEQLARLTGPTGEKYAEWARQEIPKVREQIAHVNQSVVQAATRPAESQPRRKTRRNQQPAIAHAGKPTWLPWLVAVSGVAVCIFAAVVVTSKLNRPESSKSVAESPQGGSLQQGNSATVVVEESVAEAGPATKTEPEVPRVGTEPPRAPTLIEDRPAFTPGGVEPSRRAPTRPSVDELMNELDVNKDEKLSPEEIPHPERPHLMRADTDRDGHLTREELDIMFLFTPGPPPPPRR